MTVTEPVELFSTGLVVCGLRAYAVLTKEEMDKALLRHISGDWGDLDEWDWKLNNDALEYGGCLRSRYHNSNGKTFWIITQHDRSVTTILLAIEY